MTQPVTDEAEALLEAPATTYGFAEDARRAAVAESVGLLATYFSGGSQDLSRSHGPGRALDEDEATELVVAALRLRVALAATDRLMSIIERIRRRPNFRYLTRKEETEGWPRGRLDAGRLARNSWRVTAPMKYPVINVVRAAVTPENTLVVVAARWLQRELTSRSVTSVLPRESPERDAVSATISRLRRQLSDPVFAVCAANAIDVDRRRGMRKLASEVRKRLRGGHVSNPGPYRDLLEWLDELTSGEPSPIAGEIDWAFYGDAFDTKLFELWTLSVVSKRLAEVLDLAWTPPLLVNRHRSAMFDWSTTAGDISLYFQRSLPSLDLGITATWHRIDSNRALRGTPDITAVVTPLSGDPVVVLLDPKLRQRDTAPVEELYKILGYFNNYGLDTAGLGAIIFYAGKDDPRSFDYESASAGRLLAVSVAPERPAVNVESVDALVSLILRPLGAETLPEQAPVSAGSGVDASEVDAARAQQIQVELLRAIATSLGPNGIQPWMSQAEVLIGDAWEHANSDVREMIATAIYVGNTLEADRDFSGPVLGLSAAAESLLWDHVMSPAATSCAEVLETKMLGPTIAMIERAARGGVTRPADLAVRAVLEAKPNLLAEMAQIADALQEMNREYRRPAAHRTLTSRSRWLACQRFMLLGNKPLLPRLAEALLT